MAMEGPAESNQDETPADSPQLAVSSAEVAPTEDDLQLDSEIDGDPVYRLQTPPVAIVAASTGGWWSIPMLCAGIAIIACSLVIPQIDANHKLAWETKKLTADLASIQKQVEVNQQFLSKVGEDPNLAERLAQRQMKVYRQGTAVLDLPQNEKSGMSPFLLTTVVPPAPFLPYRSHSGLLEGIFLQSRLNLYLSGLGLMLIAFGLLSGGTRLSSKSRDKA
jgi:hypothetical protein